MTNIRHFRPNAASGYMNLDTVALAAMGFSLLTVILLTLSLTALCGLVFILFMALHMLFTLTGAVGSLYVAGDHFGQATLFLIGMSTLFLIACKQRTFAMEAVM